MKVIGLTGDFGTGKSSVAKMFEELGAGVVDADAIVSDLYKQKSVQRDLQRAFGKEIVSKKGEVKRRELAKIVFSDKSMLSKINSLVHPLVKEELKKRVEEFKALGKQFVVLDIPLLFESKQRFEYSILIVVKCSKKEQFLRLRKKGFSMDDILVRVYSQLPIEQKLKAADFVINNSGDLERTKKEVKKVFDKISKLNG